MAERPVVLHGKFAAWLSWSQPFVHALVRGLDAHCRNVVLCNRAENLDRFPVAHLVRMRLPFLVEPGRAMLAAAHLRDAWAPDVLHAHFGWSGLRMILLRAFLDVPLVVTFGGRDAAVQMRLPHLAPLYRLLLEAADRIVCVSDDLRSRLLDAGADPARVETVRRGVDLDRFAFVDRASRAADAPLRLLSVGRLVAKKGHDDAIRALAQLRAAGVDAALEIVGEGEALGALRRLAAHERIADAVRFVGAVPRDEVVRRLGAADVLVHAARTSAGGDAEGIPNAVVEAAATGLAVVATRHGGIPEVVADGVHGLLVPEGDAAALAAALARLAADPALRGRLGASAAERVRRELDGARQVARHVEIYRELAAAGAPPRPSVPDDFLDLVRAAARSDDAHAELSVAELAESALAADRVGPRMLEPRATLGERLYGLKRYVPSGAKFRVKRALGAALARGAARRGRGAPPRRVDALALAHLRAGGTLAGVDPAWSTDELAARLASRLDARAEGESA